MLSCFRCGEREGVDSQQSHFSTFALMARQVKADREHLVFVPFFGPFAEQQLTFSVMRSERMPMLLRVTVKSGDSALTAFYHRSGRSELERGGSSDRGGGGGGVTTPSSFVDRCISFAHDDAALKVCASRQSQPQSLKFLCKKAVLLQSDSLPIHRLPRQACRQLSGATETVHVRLWRQNGAGPSLVKLRVKPRISLAELKWMLRDKVGREAWPSATQGVSFYADDGAGNADQSLSLETARAGPAGNDPRGIDCVLAAPRCETRPSVVVSLMGRGLEDVSARPDMTLREFERAVRSKFGLRGDSFLYVPQVMQGRRHRYGQAEVELQMYAPLGGGTSSLVGPLRAFPVVSSEAGCYHVTLCSLHEKLEVYGRSIAELGILYAPSALVVYEITGPTLTIPFRTIKGQEEGGVVTSPGGRRGGGRDSVFALISEQTHVISVNSTWKRETLLKYIECLTGLPSDSV